MPARQGAVRPRRGTSKGRRCSTAVLSEFFAPARMLAAGWALRGAPCAKAGPGLAPHAPACGPTRSGHLRPSAVGVAAGGAPHGLRPAVAPATVDDTTAFAPAPPPLLLSRA